jgi:hypothetical protein
MGLYFIYSRINQGLPPLANDRPPLHGSITRCSRCYEGLPPLAIDAPPLHG